MMKKKHARSVPELTWRCMGLSMVLAMLLAMSNAYLALKLGILASASIPAAIISMGVLRLFKNATVLEHNAVQTAASAGEAVAGGIVYTIPALIIIGYWHHFDYLTNVLIATMICYYLNFVVNNIRCTSTRNVLNIFFTNQFTKLFNS